VRPAANGSVPQAIPARVLRWPTGRFFLNGARTRRRPLRPAANSTGTSALLIAVSRTNNPTGPWKTCSGINTTADGIAAFGGPCPVSANQPLNRRRTRTGFTSTTKRVLAGDVRVFRRRTGLRDRQGPRFERRERRGTVDITARRFLAGPAGQRHRSRTPIQPANRAARRSLRRAGTPKLFMRRARIPTTRLDKPAHGVGR